MPGNRALFDRAMEQSREAARLMNWDEALKQAVRALQEFPQDLDARSAVAVALFNTGKYAQALQMFDELRRIDASNPFFLEYLARTHERLGDLKAATNAYVQLADLQMNRKLAARAIDALHEALRLQPDADDQRLRLAQLLADHGAATDAAAHYLELARRSQARGQLEQAAELAEMALRCEPDNREVKELIAALHDALATTVQSAIEATTTVADATPLPMIGTGGLRGAHIAIDRIVALAHERQEAGDIDGAIEQYERALKLGTDRSDVFYSLGLLYQERGEYQRAVELLQSAAGDQEYALSAHYMLGQAYQALGQLPEAAHEYEETIRLLPLESIGRAEADDMIQMYESAAQIYIQLNDIARAATLYSTLANFLQGKRWGRERADEFRQKAKDLTERNMFAKLRTLGTGALTSPPPAPEPEAPLDNPMPETWGKIRPITDFLRSPESQTSGEQLDAAPSVAGEPVDPLAVLEALPPPERAPAAPVTPLDTTGLDDICERYVLASEKYIEQGLMLAANDACMEVIRLNPDYLPIHLRLGEIYERDGRKDEALIKYQLLIDTYVARGEPQRAIDVYYRLIELSPDTILPRSRLAELLRAEGRNEEAAQQLAIVAGAYFRMGQTTKALEEYRRALQWSPANAELHAQYGQALLKLDRTEAALVAFRRALELDQRNPVHIARINMALAIMGEQPAAIWQSLATLLDQLKQHPERQNEVQSEYRAALLVADLPILHYILGIIQQQAGQHPSALLEFEQALELLNTESDPILTPHLVHQALADSHIALGQASDALSQLQRSLELPPAPPPPDGARYPFSTPLSQGETVRRMAEAYAAVGDLAGAERALQEAKQFLPYDRAIYTKLSDIYFRQGRLNEALAQLDELATHYEQRQLLDRAIEALENALRLAPNNIPISHRLAKMYIRRGYLDKGVEALTRVAELQRKEGQIKDAIANLQQAAEVHWTLGRQEEARALYDKIVHIAPNDIEARQWLSFMYTLAGMTREAIAQKKQIIRILLQRRDLDNAIAEMHQIYGLDQNDTDNLFQLGDALMRRQEYEQAIRIYNRLAKIPGVEIERVEALQAAAKRMLEQQQAGTR
ncbi:MAG: tetratricopeptide repeat protein [Roseiflexaceae bacterium]|nr:tetratricopeptide repeat protein [Roseiflexus sp.]MDW8212064.1 tetratricopeptide repeat protein [Roseiflexaceae bacterium]